MNIDKQNTRPEPQNLLVCAAHELEISDQINPHVWEEPDEYDHAPVEMP